MSSEPGYDYDFEVTIRPDERFTGWVKREAVESVLGEITDPARLAVQMEVQFRRWDERIGEPIDGGDRANCVYLRIPALARGPDRDHKYFAVAFSIADQLGWQVFDDTDSGAMMSRSWAVPEAPKAKPWWKAW
jgi:hypothetical protein